MSAFMVTNAHVDVLLSYMNNRDGKDALNWVLRRQHKHDVECGDFTEIGRILLRENAKSVNCRYDNAEPQAFEQAESYRFRFTIKPIAQSAVAVIKQAHCLDYQSCEHDEWSDSLAKKILDAIISHATHRLPGYDAAPWGVDEGTHTVELVRM